MTEESPWKPECPYLDVEYLACHAVILPSPMTVPVEKRPTWVVPSDLWKCRALYKDCPFCQRQIKKDRFFERDPRERRMDQLSPWTEPKSIKPLKIERIE